MIVQCRGRRSAARARASAPTVSAADFPICCRWPRTSLRSPAAGVIIDRPSSIVAPNLRTTIPLNRNGDVNQQPLRRPGGSSRSLCSAQPRPMRLGLPAHPLRARVWVASQVNAANFLW